MNTTAKQLSNGCQTRHLAGNMIFNGATNDEIIDALNASLSSIKRWRKIIDVRGLQGLVRKPGSGRPCRLDVTQKRKLKQLLRKGARECGYNRDRWTTKIVANLIFREFQIRYHFNHVGKILRKLNFRPVKPTRKSKKHDPAKVKHWARYVWPNIKKVA
jgi:putative transposase